MRVLLLISLLLFWGCSKNRGHSVTVVQPVQPSQESSVSLETDYGDRENQAYVPDRIAEMLRIQQTIDDLPTLPDGHDHFVFVGRIKEIRARSDEDVMIGRGDNENGAVAIIEIVDTASNRHQNIIAGARIAVPVGNSKSIWEMFRQPETDIVFEYLKHERRETVWKYGC